MKKYLFFCLVLVSLAIPTASFASSETVVEPAVSTSIEDQRVALMKQLLSLLQIYVQLLQQQIVSSVPQLTPVVLGVSTTTEPVMATTTTRRSGGGGGGGSSRSTPTPAPIPAFIVVTSNDYSLPKLLDIKYSSDPDEQIESHIGTLILTNISSTPTTLKSISFTTDKNLGDLPVNITKMYLRQAESGSYEDFLKSTTTDGVSTGNSHVFENINLTIPANSERRISLVFQTEVAPISTAPGEQFNLIFNPADIKFLETRTQISINNTFTIPVKLHAEE